MAINEELKNKIKMKWVNAMSIGMVKDLRERGCTTEEISETMNVSVERVNRITMRVNMMKEIEVKARKMHEDGYSYVEIAKTLNMKESTIRSVLNKK